MGGALLVIGSLACLVWLMLQMPIRKSTPELYEEYGKKDKEESKE